MGITFDFRMEKKTKRVVSSFKIDEDVLMAVKIATPLCYFTDDSETNQ